MCDIVVEHSDGRNDDIWNGDQFRWSLSGEILLIFTNAEDGVPEPVSAYAPGVWTKVTEVRKDSEADKKQRHLASVVQHPARLFGRTLDDYAAMTGREAHYYRRLLNELLERNDDVSICARPFVRQALELLDGDGVPPTVAMLIPVDKGDEDVSEPE